MNFLNRMQKELAMKRFSFLMVCAVMVLAAACNAWGDTADLEDLTLNPESYWNGDDGSGGFTSHGFRFSNVYNMDWFTWEGFAYSNITDTEAAGLAAQYNCIAGAGAEKSEIYAVGYVSAFSGLLPTVTLATEQTLTGAYFTNNNYAYYSMKNGDDFAKKFTDADWFQLTITGLDAQGAETGTVEFKLADGTQILQDWTWVDLSSLGAVKQLTFSLSSTDNGDWGMNTPSYFCMDSLNKIQKKDDHDDDSTCFIQSLARD